jgi:hypothetical protein
VREGEASANEFVASANEFVEVEDALEVSLALPSLKPKA